MISSIFRKACGVREAWTIAALCTSLLLRTLGSVWVAKHWGRIVGAIVSRKWGALKGHMTIFAVATVALAFLNAFLKYYITLLKEHVRQKLTNWCHGQLLRPNDMIFYKANKLGPAKIENSDHQMTSDVNLFADLFSSVLSQSLKPIVDFVVYSVELSRVQGLATPLTLYGWFAVASMISTVTLPPFGQLAAREQQLDGQFRGTHSELITHCEQIAFLSGEKPEKKQLDAKFMDLYNHCIKTINLSFRSEVVRQYLNKYFVTVIGLFLVSRPVRLGTGQFADAKNLTSAAISTYFVSTWKNMEAISTSIQDLFELTNRVGKLSGFAVRVNSLMHRLEFYPPVLQDEVDAAMKGPNAPKFLKGENLIFDKVSIYKPDGTLLCKNLNFTIKAGDRILVTGGNGCGKSSMFRVIRKLWPLVEGTITMPEEEDIYFLTQVNFVPVGSLRDLVTYPFDKEEMETRGRTDAEVLQCLEWAHVSPKVIEDGKAQLQFTVEGEIVRPELHAVRDWQKDLSPGQKQKLAFARLFFHKPRFVVLDECTNGISPDVEQSLYERCSNLNLGVFSISHKIELKEFHDMELHFNNDDQGSYLYESCEKTRGRILK